MLTINVVNLCVINHSPDYQQSTSVNGTRSAVLSLLSDCRIIDLKFANETLMLLTADQGT